MFNLEKHEKLLMLFLVLTLLAAVGVSVCRKSRPAVDIHSSRAPLRVPIDTYALEGPRIDINHADAYELAKLKGIGKTLAGRIIDYRIAHGPFSSPEEIMKVKGLGKALFEKIKGNITVE